MIKVGEILKQMNRHYYNSDAHDLVNMPHHKLKLILFAAWKEEPLLCYYPDGQEVLAIVIEGDGYNVRDLAITDKMWKISCTVLGVMAKFDSWEEAMNYFLEKKTLNKDEAIMNNLYVHKAKERM